MKTLVIIPSRLSASRLPGKPLLKIKGLSIISHVYKRAQEADIGEVFVAAEDQEIIEDVKKNGGEAILTNNNHKTGTDRIYEAFVKLGRTDIDLIMNLQGDEPLMNIEDIQNLNKHMIQTKHDLGTLAARIKNKKVFENHDIVKVITEESLDDTKFPRAINFMRKLDKENNLADFIRSQGVEIYSPDLDAFRTHVQAQYVGSEFAASWPDGVLEKINALGN